MKYINKNTRIAKYLLVNVTNYICVEILADEWNPGPLTNGDFKDVLELDGETIELGVHQI